MASAIEKKGPTMRTKDANQNLTGETEELMDSNAQEGGEKLAELRARLDSAIESAKVAAQRLQEKTVAAAKATDECIRSHPYQTLGVAFGLGLLIGVLVGRRRD